MTEAEGDVKKGLVNLEKHLENISYFKVPVIVALNHFRNDKEDEIQIVEDFCNSKNIAFSVADIWSQGGEGGIELAKEVARAQFRQYGMMDVPDEHLDGFVNQMISKNEDRNRLFNKKMEDKIMDVVKSKVTVEVKEVSKEDFEKLFEK